MRRTKRSVPALLLFMILSGCTLNGDSLSTLIDASYLSIDATADTIYQECQNPTPRDPCVATSLITTEQAAEWGEMLQEAKDQTDAANRIWQTYEACRAGAMPGACSSAGVTGQLQTARTVLQSVRTMLTEAGVES